VAAQIQLHRTAASHHVTAARLAGPSYAKRPDLCATACQLLVEASSGLPLAHAATKALLVAPLAAAAAALNGMKHAAAEAVNFQIGFNCLLLDCFATADRWADALAHCRAMRRAVPHLMTQRGVAGRMGACLARAGGERAAEEMTRLQADLVLPEIKARTWQAFAQHSSSPSDQLAARRAGLAVLNDYPLLKVEYSIEFAEWLVTVDRGSAAGGVGGSTDDSKLAGLAAAFDLEPLPVAEALLLEAAGILVDDDNDGDKQQGGATAISTSAAPATGTARLPTSATQRSTRQSARSKQQPGDASSSAPPAILGPKSLPAAARLSSLVRVFVLLAQVAREGDTQLQYLLSAQHYALRLITEALTAAAAAVSEAGSSNSVTAVEVTAEAAQPAAVTSSRPGSAAIAALCTTTKPTAPPTAGLSPTAPHTQINWALWQEEEGTAAALAADSSSQHALSRTHISRPEALLATLDILTRQLCTTGHHLAALPVVHLRRLAGRCMGCGAGAEAAAIVQLAGVLEALELPVEAQRWLDEAWKISTAPAAAQEARTAADEAELRQLVQTACARQRGGEVHAEEESPQLSPLAPHAAALMEAAIAAATLSAVSTWTRRSSSKPPSTAGSVHRTAVQAPPLLQPLTAQDGWLARAEYLAARGQTAAAQELTKLAEEAAQLADNPHALSRCMLVHARLAVLGGDTASAAELAQAAQAAGGLGIEGWEEAALLYADARSSMPDSGEMDALKALSAGAAALDAVAAKGVAGVPAALASAAALRMHAARLLLKRAEREASVAEAEQAGSGGSAGTSRDSSAGSEHARTVAAGAAARAQALELAQEAAQGLAACGARAATLRVSSLLLLADTMLAQTALVVEGAAGAGGRDLRPALLEVWNVLQVRQGGGVRWGGLTDRALNVL